MSEAMQEVMPDAGLPAEATNAGEGAASSKTRKSSPASPTQRSLAHMRKLGYLCQVVEKYNAYARLRQDLFGFIDILCVREGSIVGVQATSASNVAGRVNKIVEHENWPIVCSSPVKVVVQGWRKIAGRWVLREVEL